MIDNCPSCGAVHRAEAPCAHKRYRGDLPCGAGPSDDWHRPTYDDDRGWHKYQPCPEYEESEKQFLRPINPDPATAMARALPKGKK